MDRGQAYTLEGTIAALVIVLSVMYGLQAIDTGPVTGSVEREADHLSTQAADFLSVTAYQGTLRSAVLCYKPSQPVIDGGTFNMSVSSRFELQLNRTFDSRGLNYNIFVSYWTDSGRQTVTFTSTDQTALAIPQENAGSATYRLALYDSANIRIQSGSSITPACGATGPPISSLTDFYIPDVNESSVLYNVVEVRIVVW